jgi:hypothetical protein
MNRVSDLFDLEHTLAKAYLAEFEYPWEALRGIQDMILALGRQLPEEYAETRSRQVLTDSTSTKKEET